MKILDIYRLFIEQKYLIKCGYYYFLQNDVNISICLKNNIPMKLNILSSNLKRLNLQNLSKTTQFELNNLPNQIEDLELFGIKYNLDYLPVSLKKLKIFHKDNYTNEKYTLNDFLNLPIGLEYIEYNRQVFNSPNNLIQTFV